MTDFSTALEWERSRGRGLESDLQQLKESYAIKNPAAEAAAERIAEAERKYAALEEQYSLQTTLANNYQLQLNLLIESQDQHKNKYHSTYAELAAAYDDAQALAINLQNGLEVERIHLQALEQLYTQEQLKNKDTIQAIQQELHSEKFYRHDLEQKLIAIQKESQALDEVQRALLEESINLEQTLTSAYEIIETMALSHQIVQTNANTYEHGLHKKRRCASWQSVNMQS